jgi:hypothetical protein
MFFYKSNNDHSERALEMVIVSNERKYVVIRRAHLQ